MNAVAPSVHGLPLSPLRDLLFGTFLLLTENRSDKTAEIPELSRMVITLSCEKRFLYVIATNLSVCCRFWSIVFDLFGDMKD